MIEFETNKLFSLFHTAKYKKEKDYCDDFRKLMRPCHNIAFVIEGMGEIETENTTITVKAGEILYIPQGATYCSHWKASPSITYHTIHFNFASHCDPLGKFIMPIQILKCKDFEQAHESFEKIYALNKENKSAFLSISLFFGLCQELFEDIKLIPIKENDNPILPALTYLNTNTSAHTTIEDLASMCFMSPSRFHFLFKKHTGLSPIVYKNNVLIQKAAEALLFEKGKSIEEISEQYGFESVIYFRRLFKKATKKTPSEYRKEDILL